MTNKTLYFSASQCGFYDSAIHTELPEDAIEISVGTHQALMAAQGAGKLIAADAEGLPIAIDPPAPSLEVLATQVRARRDALIATTDYLVMPDYPITAKQLASVKAYRQALRDITTQAGFPADVVWPEVPEVVGK
ncbi:tail fiber assembly protein [Uliginosibacterium gangwonense]|uniref:tail fiber assembly protein n=1 Tax=Uliginosibacterium gangwonense TaxID=392736 RepID=UPI00036749C2|nr:tail fiber assembly protein [Uliginosibacterium gangwonense]